MFALISHPSTKHSTCPCVTVRGRAGWKQELSSPYSQLQLSVPIWRRGPQSWLQLWQLGQTALVCFPALLLLSGLCGLTPTSQGQVLTPVRAASSFPQYRSQQVDASLMLRPRSLSTRRRRHLHKALLGRGLLSSVLFKFFMLCNEMQFSGGRCDPGTTFHLSMLVCNVWRSRLLLLAYYS